MRFIVRIPELDSALYGGSGQDSHRELFQIIRKLEKSGKLLEGGLLADDRGGYLLMEAATPSEHETLMESIFDSSRYTVESHPILPFRNLTKLVGKIEAEESHALKIRHAPKPKSEKQAHSKVH